MDYSKISLILRELNLNEDDVANIYHHGSWVYGTNSPTSDRDFIIVTRSSNNKQLKFHEDFDYYHEFELHKLWDQYDICIYSVENFEILLEKNYLAVLQFAFYEVERDLCLYAFRNYPDHPKPSSREIETSQSQMNYIFKNLFHGIRFLDFAEQLIQTKSIYNYKRVTHLFDEMKDLRGDVSDHSGMERVAEFVRNKSTEYKSKFNALIPENIVKGSFEVHITFDCPYNSKPIIDKLKKVCQNTRYKIIFIEWATDEAKENIEQLIVSSHYNGEYPAIVKEIEEEAYKHFKDFNIIRIKIKSLISNEGVPLSNLEQQFFWNEKTRTYFEVRYKILQKEALEDEKIKNLRNICRRYFKNPNELRLSYKACMPIDSKDIHPMITRCLFEVGRGNAFRQSVETLKFLTRNDFPTLKVIREFIVYDTNIELDRN